MTTNQGEMRETYPDAGEAYRYREAAAEGSLTFQLDGGVAEGSHTAITLDIESAPTGEGLCRTEVGRTHRFAWAWVGAELHLWLDGALYVFQRGQKHRDFALRELEYRRQLVIVSGTHAHADVICWNH